MRHAVLDAAVRVVDSEGDAALTMQGLAVELGSSVGAIYRYFPSKAELLAAVHEARLNVLFDRLPPRRSELDAAGGASSSAEDVALARVIAAGRSFADAAVTSPREVELATRLIAASTDDERSAECPAAARRFAAELSERLDAAVTAGALQPGSATARAVLILLMAPAPSVAAALGRFGGDPGGGPRLGHAVVDCLLRGWGATAAHLAGAARLVPAPR